MTAASSSTTAWPTQQQAVGYTSRGSCSSQLHTSKSTGSISSHTNTTFRETTFPAEGGLEPEYSECVGGLHCACKLPSEAKQTVVGARRLPWQRTSSTSMEFSPASTSPLRTLVGSSDSGLGMSAQSGETGGGSGGGTVVGPVGGGTARVPIPQVRVPAGSSAGSNHSGSLDEACTQCQQHRLGLHPGRLSHHAHAGHNNNIPSLDVMDANRLKPHDTPSPSVRPKLPGLSEWRDARTDTSSDTGDHHSNNSGVKSDDQNVVVRRRPKKSHVHRSRSDLTKRFSNSSDLSEVSARFSRNSADLEKFFNEMGLDRTVLEPMLTAQCSHTSSNLHLYESASSIDSRDAQSWCSGDNDSTKHGGGATRDRPPLPSSDVLKGAQGQTSIVERNARIIKWLCNVKRASLEESE